MKILNIFVQKNLIKIYFSVGSISLLLLILYIDKLIQDISTNKANLNEDEFKRGIKSLQMALNDNILTAEEYEQYSEELKNKYKQ